MRSTNGLKRGQGHAGQKPECEQAAAGAKDGLQRSKKATEAQYLGQLVLTFGWYFGRSFKLLAENDVGYIKYVLDRHLEETQDPKRQTPINDGWLKDSLMSYVTLFPPVSCHLEVNVDRAIYGQGQYKFFTFLEMWRWYSLHKRYQADPQAVSEQERKTVRDAHAAVKQWLLKKEGDITTKSLKRFRLYILEKEKSQSGAAHPAATPSAPPTATPSAAAPAAAAPSCAWWCDDDDHMLDALVPFESSQGKPADELSTSQPQPPAGAAPPASPEPPLLAASGKRAKKSTKKSAKSQTQQPAPPAAAAPPASPEPPLLAASEKRAKKSAKSQTQKPSKSSNRPKPKPSSRSTKRQTQQPKPSTEQPAPKPPSRTSKRQTQQPAPSSPSQPEPPIHEAQQPETSTSLLLTLALSRRCQQPACISVSACPCHHVVAERLSCKCKNDSVELEGWVRLWEDPSGIPAADVTWLKEDSERGLFTAVQTFKDIRGQIKRRRVLKSDRMWFYPPEPPGYIGGGIPSLQPFFRSHLFFWRPVGVWRCSISCPRGDACTEAGSNTHLSKSGYHIQAARGGDGGPMGHWLAWDDAILRQLSEAHQAMFPAVLTAKRGVDKNVLNLLRDRTEGNTMAKVWRQVWENHMEEHNRRWDLYTTLLMALVRPGSIVSALGHGEFRAPPPPRELPCEWLLRHAFLLAEANNVQDYRSQILSTFGTALKMDSTKKASYPRVPTVWRGPTRCTWSAASHDGTPTGALRLCLEVGRGPVSTLHRSWTASTLAASCFSGRPSNRISGPQLMFNRTSCSGWNTCFARARGNLRLSPDGLVNDGPAPEEEVYQPGDPGAKADEAYQSDKDLEDIDAARITLTNNETATVHPPAFEDACSANPLSGFQELKAFCATLVQLGGADQMLQLTTDQRNAILDAWNAVEEHDKQPQKYHQLYRTHWGNTLYCRTKRDDLGDAALIQRVKMARRYAPTQQDISPQHNRLMYVLVKLLWLSAPQSSRIGPEKASILKAYERIQHRVLVDDPAYERI
ncbi:hypothetical protein AALO_G00015660 [Alosa alosa]|uniref:DUF6729 domain-containing protein n=1 Tax=Alosa alosa TaxID=278164 RepID=A0AAV6HGL9_9TELE|nr:hypothetical protein AALO_G00015660 [Alosa alosa]